MRIPRIPFNKFKYDQFALKLKFLKTLKNEKRFPLNTTSRNTLHFHTLKIHYLVESSNIINFTKTCES